MKMANNSRYPGLCVLLFLAGACFAAQPRKTPLVGETGFEDLSACKMPHGITELPKKDSSNAREADGYIFNFKRQSLVFDPLLLKDKRPRNFQQFYDAVIKEQSGDLYFDYAEQQLFFMSFSNRIQDIGSHFLYEFDGKRLSMPDIPSYTENGETAKGLLMGVQLGHCYLMTTLQKEWVLLRIIAVDKDAEFCTIQWVRRPAGAKVFDIPRGKITQPKEPARPIFRPDRKALQAEWEKMKKYESLEAEASEFGSMTQLHLAQRQSIINKCMEALKISEKTIADPYGKNLLLSKKMWAIRTLGNLRAVEAAPLLASMIDAPIPNNFFTDEDSLGSRYGCFWALHQIGKPGAAACIEEIKKLNPADRGTIKENLLNLVLVSVEGEKVAELLLNEEMKKVGADEEKKKNIERALVLITKVSGNFYYKIEEDKTRAN